MPARRRTARDERRRSLSQNFVHPDWAERLVESADFQPGQLVLEVGAGSGVMTLALVRCHVDVIALELDPVWARKLAGVVRGGGVSRVCVVRGDVLTFPLPTRPFRVVGNLPFGATTAILRRLLADPSIPLQRADLIVQWEVARKRSAIPPDTLLGTTWAPWWEFELGDRIPSTAFRPVPSVEACHLVIRRRASPLLPPEMGAAHGDFVRTWWTRRRGIEERPGAP
ncbi:MAG: ribosomal RNA small subunit methyltransferase A [Candidatus Dormibacteria bacterium]